MTSSMALSGLTQLSRIVLENNYFDFNGRHFLQIAYTAMGTKLAPIYANLFMYNFEGIFIYTYSQKPIILNRFIDDIL